MTEMTRIDLRQCLDYPVLIVPAKTGIVYTNQTGGCFCNHPELEGYLVPIIVNELPQREIFNPDVWYKRGGIVIEPPNALRSAPLANDNEEIKSKEFILWWENARREIEEISRGLIQVIKDVHQEEAWFWVRAKLDGELSSSGEWTKCVLTWVNSD